MLSKSEFERNEDTDGDQMVAVYQIADVRKDGQELLMSGMVKHIRKLNKRKH